MKNKKIQKITGIVLLFSIWQIAAIIIDQRLLLASPLDVLIRLFTIWKEKGFFSIVLFSFIRICGGFLLGVFAGVLLALLAGKSAFIENLLSPLLLTVKSVPIASLIILFLIWLSSSQLSVCISFMMVLPVIYSNVLEGIKGIDIRMIEMADVFRLYRKKRFMFIWIPQIKSYLISGCRIALGLSWKSGIAAEVIGIPPGSIGEQLYLSKTNFSTDDLFTWTVIIVFVSFLFEKVFLSILNALFRRVEKYEKY